jgi:hypothetical protein
MKYKIITSQVIPIYKVNRRRSLFERIKKYFFKKYERKNRVFFIIKNIVYCNPFNLELVKKKLKWKIIL